MKKLSIFCLMLFLTVSMSNLANAVGIGNGSLNDAGLGAWGHHYAWLNPSGYDFATNRHSFDMTSSGLMALGGWVDLSAAQRANPGDWSKYYFSITIRDNTNKTVSINFANDCLGSWHAIPPQPWDRIRHESNITPAGPSAYYATEGGTHDMGGGGPIYPTDQLYYVQTIFNPVTQIFDLWVFGKGNGGNQAPPNSNNSVDYKQWFNLGQWDRSGLGYDFSHVEFYADMMRSSQAGSGEISTVSWWDLKIGAPISLNQDPVFIPEPGTILLVGSGFLGLGFIGWFRRKRA